MCIKDRGRLVRSADAIKSGRISVGFIGGSITAGHPHTGGMESNWPDFIRGWFMRKYPNVRLTLLNTAIGGNGTLSGIMRARKEISEPDCDLVFIECAVNDGTGESFIRIQEGLIRQLLEKRRDIVLVYTFSQSMYQDMAAHRVPPSITQLESLAERYRIPSVWMGKHALDAIRSGIVSWSAFLPESGGRIHPERAGSGLYAEQVIEYLEKSLSGNENEGEEIPFGNYLPEPVEPGYYGRINEIAPEHWNISGPWVWMRELACPWYERVLYTTSPSAELSFSFRGRALAAHLNFGRRSAVWRCRIDGGEWIEIYGPRVYYVPEQDYCMALMLAENLPLGDHIFELTLFHGDSEFCTGTDCKIYTFVEME